jgi:DNA-directed RNA polymerase specialized sigma subunit
MKKRTIYKLNLDQAQKIKNKKLKEMKHKVDPARGFEGFQYSLEQREFIQEKMYDLDTHEFMVLYLKFWKDFTDKEITKLLLISDSTLINIIDDCLRKLRTIYENEFEAWQKNLKIRMGQFDEDNQPGGGDDLAS